MGDIQCELGYRASGTQPHRQTSHQLMPDLPQRSRPSVIRQDAPLRQPTNVTSREACSADSKGWIGVITGSDPRNANYTWSSSNSSYSDSITGRRLSSHIDFEQMTTGYGSDVPHETDKVHTTTFNPAVFVKKRLDRTYRAGIANKQIRSEPVSRSTTSSEERSCLAEHDHVTAPFIWDNRAEGIFEPPSPSGNGIELWSSLTANVVPRMDYIYAEPAAVAHESDGRQELSVSQESKADYMSSSSVNFVPLQRVPEDHDSAASVPVHDSNEIDYPNNTPADRELQDFSSRHDSMMFNESYDGTCFASQSRSQHTMAVIPSKDPGFRTRAIKRHATDMAGDFQSKSLDARKSLRSNACHGHRRAFSLDTDLTSTSSTRRESCEIHIKHTAYDSASRTIAARRANSNRRPASIAYEIPSRAQGHSEQGSQMTPVSKATDPFVAHKGPNHGGCEAWLVDQAEQSKEKDQDGPVNTPSTLYDPVSPSTSELVDCERGGPESTCIGVLAMRSYLAAKGPRHACTTATSEDAEELLVELTRFSIPTSMHLDRLPLHRFLELIAPTAKEVHRDVDIDTVRSWHLACDIGHDDILESDDLPEALMLVCIELCNLGLMVFQLACFVANFLRSLDDISHGHSVENTCAVYVHTPSSSQSGCSEGRQRDHVAYGDHSASASNIFEMGDTGNTGTGKSNNGKRPLSRDQDQGDEDSGARQPGQDGNDEANSGVSSDLMGCVDEDCDTKHGFISEIRRCLKKGNCAVCGTCWEHFKTGKLLDEHLERDASGSQSGQSACGKYCVAPCNKAGRESLRSAEEIMDQRHRWSKSCPSSRSLDLRSAQWRYLYACKHPNCKEVPELESVQRRKKRKRKPIVRELASALPGPSHATSNDSTAVVHLQRLEIELLRKDVTDLLDLLEPILPLLANNHSWHQYVCKKVTDMRGKIPKRSFNSSGNVTAFMPATPPTPGSGTQLYQQAPINASTHEPVTMHNSQVATTSTPTHRPFQPQSARSPDAQLSSFGRQPFHHTQAASTIYQQRVAPPDQGNNQATMHPPQPRAFGHLLQPQNPARYITQPFHGNEQGLSGSAQPWLQTQPQNRSEAMTYDCPQLDYTDQQPHNFDLNPQNGMQMQPYHHSRPETCDLSLLGHSNQQVPALDLSAQQGIQTQLFNMNNYSGLNEFG